MNLVFIIKNRDKTPFMIVRTTPDGSTFEPMSKPAKDLVGILRQEYGKTPITKPELIQSMDSSKIIEGPSPSGTAVQKKIANIAFIGEDSRELPVLSISEVLLSEFSTEEFKNVLTFKASSFISDQTRASAHFEIKGVRAIWDPSLAIPGTNRRGGFRCPVGTRYGGQITDRFGRSCGWGVARRIANQIADIGERLEQRDDGKRKRRLDRRNARMIRRLGGSVGEGRVEGGLRGIAERLDGGAEPTPKRRLNAEQREENRQRAREELRVLRDQVVDIVRPRGGRRGETESRTDAESRTPPARAPRNRRRDVIPETAPTPTPAPARRPAPRPRPAGRRRPQPRPRVDSETGNVDVLTARDASDAGETEDFKPYVLRKYNEYAKRVREIRLAGGDAGMLTRREWYTINKDNLRDAWKDAHGRSAPSDFEPPTPKPRRPRNNRRRRRQATAEGAGRSATRRPTPDDVPEPAPARPVRPAARRVWADRTNVRASREAVANAIREINRDPNHVLGEEFDKQVKAILREPKAVFEVQLNELIGLVSRAEDDIRGQHRMQRQMGQRVDAAEVVKLRKLSEQHRKLRQAVNANGARRPRRQPDGRGFVTPGDGGGAPPEVRPPAAPPSGISDDFPSATEPSMTTPRPRAPRGGAKKQPSPLNRARDRHETGLPRLENGNFDEVPVGNKGIRTKAQALTHRGSLNDIPDKFLDAVIGKRSDFIQDPFGEAKPGSALAQAMFGANGATTPEQIRNLKATVARLRKSRTKNNALNAGDRETLKKLKESGVDYISFNAGTGGANPSFHLFIDNNGNMDGRGYLLKPRDRSFGNGANHAELLGAVLAEQMGFAQGQGRIIPGTSFNNILLELAPNFAEGQADNVGNVVNGANAVKDKESRLGAALLNGIMGATDRHGGNGMVFDGNGALPIDFGRSFVHRNDDAQSLFRYITSGNYRGIDGSPLEGYKQKYQELVRAGKTPQEAKDTLRTELKQSLDQWRDGMKEVLDNGVADNLASRFANNSDIGGANVQIVDRKAKIASRLDIMVSDEFVNLMMAGIN